MKVVHFSDWHASLQPLPDADLYICTGDMLPNDVWIDADPRGLGYGFKRYINRERQVEFQKEWCHDIRFVEECIPETSLKTPLICVRGNHDFIDLADLFVGMDVIEIIDPSIVHNVLGLRVGGMRGMARYIGEWNDEIDDPTAQEIQRRIPVDLDILVTHSPPLGILDDFEGKPIGLPAVASYLERIAYVGTFPTLHAFGHIHECGQRVEKRSVNAYDSLGGAIPVTVRFSNASQGINVIELEDPSGAKP